MKNKKVFFEICGTTVMGAKGQIVIPAEVRRIMNIKQGDRLVVINKMNQAIGLVKADDIEAFLKDLNVELKSIKDVQ